MIMYMLASQFNLSAENIDYLREIALKDVAKLKGKISLESIADFTSDKEERYKNERGSQEHIIRTRFLSIVQFHGCVKVP